MMKIKYSNHSIFLKLAKGVLFLFGGLIGIYFEDGSRSFLFLFAGIGLVNLVLFVIEFFNNYVEIENGIISRKGLFGKRLIISELTKIEEIGNDFILEANENKLVINLKRIDINNYDKLKDVLLK